MNHDCPSVVTGKDGCNLRVLLQVECQVCSWVLQVVPVQEVQMSVRFQPVFPAGLAATRFALSVCGLQACASFPGQQHMPVPQLQQM